MKKVAIFMSDFHMGKGDGLEEFYADKEFVELLARLSDEYGPDPEAEPPKSQGDQIDLVLLGDIMDIWTTVKDADDRLEQAEVKGEKAGDVTLYFPAADGDPLANATLAAARAGEEEKVKAIIKAHPEVFQALARFLVDDPWNRRIIYIPGNHDHSVVDEGIQAQIQEEILKWCTRGLEQIWSHFLIGSNEGLIFSGAAVAQPERLAYERLMKRPNFVQGGTTSVEDEQGRAAEVARITDLMTRWASAQDPTRGELKKRIVFQNYYLDEHLQIYAEHGNQLAYGDVFRYESFDKFGAECPGYYELKLVWNRLERKAPDMDNVLLGALAPELWPGLFWWLLIKGKITLWGLLQKFHTQYEADGRVQKAKKWRGREGLGWMPSPLKAWCKILWLSRPRWLGGTTQDEFNDAVPALFDPNGRFQPLCRTVPLERGMQNNGPAFLDPKKFRTVVLGHSHHSKDKDIILPSGEKVKYYNTGSWIQRYEKRTWLGKGRNVTQQTWVTVSREIPVDGQSVPRDVLDRELTVRNVERENDAGVPSRKQQQNGKEQNPLKIRNVEEVQETSSPITPRGVTLNSISRKMTDIQVGDILLIRGNYGATIQRMFVSFQWPALVKAIPDMIAGWFNRRGTFSSWNHVALVYASPSEPDGRDYNDLLIIEAVPEAGVAIHGPQHYMEFPKEHDLAVLRPNVPWLNRNWDNRRLVRQFALASLESHYDFKVIMRQTIFHTVLSMDRPGRSPVAGLVKGGFFGAFAGLIIAPLIAYYHWWTEDIRLAWGTVFTQVWATIRSMYQIISTFPRVLEDVLFQVIAGVLLSLVLGIALYACYGVLRAIWLAALYAAAAVGAVIGALLVPVVAELSGEWERKPATWKWANTVVWITIVGTVLSVHLLRLFLGQGTLPESISTHVDILLVWFAFFLAVLVTWFGTYLTRIVEWFVMLLTPALKVLAWPFRLLLIRIGLSAEPDDPASLQSVGKEFICSGLAQEALERTAEALGENPTEVRPVSADPSSDDNPLHNIRWQDVLPKHFANPRTNGKPDPGKFEWVYLLTKGRLIPKPDAGLIAEASPEPLDVERRKLSEKAAWALRLALFGLLLVPTFHLFEDVSSRGLLLVGGAFLSLAALWLARAAWFDLALNPTTKRGAALQYWGQLLGYSGLLATLTVAGFSWSDWSLNPQTVAAGLAFMLGTWLTLF